MSALELQPLSLIFGGSDI